MGKPSQAGHSRSLERANSQGSRRRTWTLSIPRLISRSPQAEVLRPTFQSGLSPTTDRPENQRDKMWVCKGGKFCVHALHQAHSACSLISGCPLSEACMNPVWAKELCGKGSDSMAVMTGRTLIPQHGGGIVGQKLRTEEGTGALRPK